MRLAIISDIHGNIVALEAVLANIQKERIDQIICLGDVATLGPQPRESIARVKSLGCPCVMGNHDEFLLDSDLINVYTQEPFIRKSIEWCRQQLNDDDIAFIKTFSATFKIPLDANNSLLCFHGSPRSNTEIIVASTPNAEVEEMLNGQLATIMAGGHTHIQMLRQYKDGFFILNPGSVGEPFDETPPLGAPPRLLLCAEYAIITWQDGNMSVDLRRISFDRELVKQQLTASDLPMRSWLLQQYT